MNIPSPNHKAGTRFTKNGFEMAGRSLGRFRLLIVAMKGDQKMFKDVFRQTRSWAHHSICCFCGATRLPQTLPYWVGN